MDIIRYVIHCDENQIIGDESKSILKKYAEAKGINFPETTDYDEKLANSKTKEEITAENNDGIGCGIVIVVISILIFLTALVTDMREAKKPLFIIGVPTLLLGGVMIAGYANLEADSDENDSREIEKARRIKEKNQVRENQFYITSLTKAKEDYNRYVAFLLSNPSQDEINEYNEKECVTGIEKDLFTQTVSQINKDNIRLVKDTGKKNIGSSYPCVSNSIGCTVTLKDDYIVINKGKMFQTLNFFDTDANTVKIPLETITVINHKPSGILDGYLEFVYQGFIPRNNDTSKHAQENVITFRGYEENSIFLAFKEMIEKKVREVKNKSVSSPNISIAEEIQKLADLKEKGILTEDEFQIQKRKLINS